MGDLTKDFSISEFAVSAQFPRLVKPVPSEYVTKYRWMCEKILQPLRDLCAWPITVNSGYRSAELNAALRGSGTSQHLLGEAADITGANTLWMMVALMGMKPRAGQIIYYPKRNFIHVALANRKYPEATFYVSPEDKKYLIIGSLKGLASCIPD